jgi:hypothetical protein
VVVCMAWAGQAFAQAPCSRCENGSPGCCKWQTCPSVGCCPDDYCRKPCPLINPLSYCGGCDDYCRKPEPCIANISRCGSCDDYCRKPLPCLLCPPQSPYLQCGPSERCCSTCGKR